MKFLDRIDNYLDEARDEAPILTKRQKANVVVYDNGGKTIDRYTVIINGEGYVMSSDADSPGGVNQYIGKAGRDFKVDKSLGKKIKKYPKGVSKAILDKRYVPGTFKAYHRKNEEMEILKRIDNYLDEAKSKDSMIAGILDYHEDSTNYKTNKKWFDALYKELNKVGMPKGETITDWLSKLPNKVLTKFWNAAGLH